MSTLASLVVKITGDTGQLLSQLDLADARLQRFGRRADRLGQQATRGGAMLTAGLTLPIVGMGAASLSASTNFNRGMANVASLIPGNTERVAELREEVLDLAPAMGKTTTDLTDGLYQVISAFGDTSDSIRVLEINARAATAGVATTTDAINLTSAVTKGYGDTSAEAVQHASDLALLTVRLGQTTFPELASSIGRVTPLAAALGVTQEELFAVMATGTGVTGGAAEVSTQLRGVLQALLVPTADMAALYEELGVESGEALLKQEGLPGALEAIMAAAERSGQPLQRYISSIEGQTLALALAGPQADSFMDKLSEMQNAAGATDAAFREQTEGANRAGFAWQQFKVKLETFLIRAGDKLAPVLEQVIPVLDVLLTGALGLVDAFGGLPAPLQLGIIAFGGLLAAVGPLLLMFGAMASGIGAIIAVAPLLGTAITVATGPFGVIALAIAALIAAGILLWQNWDTVKEKAGQLQAWLGNRFAAIRDKVTGVISGLKDWLLDHWQQIVTGVLAIVFPPGAGLFLLITHFDAVKSKLGEIMGALGELVHGAWDGIVSGIKGAINAIIGAINHFIRALNNIEISVPGVSIPLGPDIPGFSIGLPDIPEIPQLKHGGIVTRPTLALMGEAGPEAVIPLRSGSGGTTVVEQHFHIAGSVVSLRELEELSVRAVVRASERGAFRGTRLAGVVR